MECESSPGLCVALGSSFLGYYAHAGFLNGLVAGGAMPQRISGASAGALAGGLFAVGLRGAALETAVLDPALRWSFFDWLAFCRLPGLVAGIGASGLLSGTRAVRHLRTLVGDIDLSALDAPAIEIAVTDAADFRPRILHSGPLAELIVASCAIPGLIKIQRIGTNRYLDGGVACDLPFEHWLGAPGGRTILIHRICRDAGAATRRRESIFDVIGSVHRTVCGELHRHRIALAQVAAVRVIEIETATPAPAVLGNRHARTCHDLGFESGVRAAAAIVPQ